MDVIQRSNVVVRGQGRQPMLFAHGFGCDQQMWRFVAPSFEASHRVVLFDHIGCGKADLAAYDSQRHARIEGYADDMLDIIEALELRDIVFVGHSVSAMMGVLAAIRAPERFAQLVLVGPSPRYLNDAAGYVGGFERADIDSLIDLMDTNMLGWADFLAPAVMGSGAGIELTQELKASFCASDAYVARRFALATFLADNRADLHKVRVPTLVIQCSDDAIAPLAVGQYVHAQIPGSTLRVLQASGHCPHMTHPEATIQLIRETLAPTA